MAKKKKVDEPIKKEWEIIYDFLKVQEGAKSNSNIRSIMLDVKRLSLEYGQLIRYYQVLLERKNNEPAHPSLRWKIGYLENIADDLEKLGVVYK